MKPTDIRGAELHAAGAKGAELPVKLPAWIVGEQLATHIATDIESQRPNCVRMVCWIPR